MTLSVNASWIDDSGIERDLPLRSALAGVETSRHTFYGSPQACARLSLLPRLREQACVVFGSETFDALLSELDVLEAIARAEGTHDAHWSVRLANVRTAVETAWAQGPAGRVVIG